jgi:alpha-galactosidase/6-phospho-beta-glucosidase family protein
MPAAKISIEVIRVLRDAMESGHYREVACKLAGIDRKTLLNWLKRGAREQSGLYRELFEAVERAEAKAEEFHLKNINDASKKNWYASAWYLERKHPERWAKREPVPPDDDGPKDEVVVIG